MGVFRFIYFRVIPFCLFILNPLEGSHYMQDMFKQWVDRLYLFEVEYL
jgi:hypothetical protein